MPLNAFDAGAARDLRRFPQSDCRDRLAPIPKQAGIAGVPGQATCACGVRKPDDAAYGLPGRVSLSSRGHRRAEESALAYVIYVSPSAPVDRTGGAPSTLCRIQGARDRRASPRARDPEASGRETDRQARRSCLPVGGKSTTPSPALVLVLCHPGDPASLASHTGRPPLDLAKPGTWSPPDRA
jgi:hypothetical protein